MIRLTYVQVVESGSCLPCKEGRGDEARSVEGSADEHAHVAILYA